MMPSGKSSIAWFKLAEFVARREKERAIAVYRLLAHALSDEAYSLQLGGDLMEAFDDGERAREFYSEAAKQYAAAMRFFQAGYMYEKIVLGYGYNASCHTWLNLITSFDYADREKKIILYAPRAVASIYAVHQDYQDALHTIDTMECSLKTKQLLHTHLSIYAAETSSQQKQWNSGSELYSNL